MSKKKKAEELRDLGELIDVHFDKLQKLSKNPFLNRNKIKVEEKVIQALEEGQASDVLTSNVTGTGTSRITAVVDKNNYATYAKQVNDINEMYNNCTDYGGELLRSSIDMRAAFIGGGGMSVLTEDEELAEWIDSFLAYNKLNGSNLIQNITLGEMEGKDLMVIFPDNKEKNATVRSYSWYRSPYEVTMEKSNNQKIKSVSYQKNITSTGDEVAKPENLVYVKLGGSPDRVNRTPPRVSNILTDIENASRAKYDLRKNNHLFGRVTPYFETTDDKQAQTLQERIAALAWRIGKAIAGTAKFSLVEPSGKGSEVLTEEFKLLIKIISMNTGIPLQWLAWPDILSNRAVAETMIETINAMTAKERMIWEEAFKELIQKAMAMAFERKYINFNKPNDFEVKLSLVNFAMLKQIIETWVPLAEKGFIADDTVRTQIPSIDPYKEKALLMKQKEEAMEQFNTDISLRQELSDEDEETEEQEPTNEQKTT